VVSGDARKDAEIRQSKRELAKPTERKLTACKNEARAKQMRPADDCIRDIDI